MGLTVVQCSCLHSLVVKFIFVGWELSFDVVSTIFYKVNRTTASSPQIVFSCGIQGNQTSFAYKFC
jgi:hypothetical protein